MQDNESRVTSRAGSILFQLKYKGSLKECAPRALAAGVADGEKPASEKNRMPKDHINWILAQKPMSPPPRYAALKQRNPDLTPLPGEEADEELMELYFVAKAFFEMEEKFPKTQE
ncbi:hypothetical protein EJB05_26857 [Eragrostis curvula]|uniref:Uncharacterized protein n=1 Tax=Eragrostis curvula TaxID=38414 RepID=A0A5J9UKU2_9POAL|nr:hypothetical protein EJB05_26857 [Eragrostis curvula]